MDMMAKTGRSLWSLIYRRHVGLEFPIDMVLRERKALPPVHGAHHVVQPPPAGDAQAIATLLNGDPGFGHWTVQRVERELFARMAHPEAGSLILHNVHGIFLYVAPEHRRRTGLGTFVVFSIFGSCVDAVYERILAFTDVTRSAALLLYLSKGARPVPMSLGCIWRWRGIHRRLRTDEAA